MLAVAVAVKFTGRYLGAYLGAKRRHSACAIGFGLMPQGAIGIILAFLALGVLADQRNRFCRVDFDRVRDFDPERTAHQVGDGAPTFEDRPRGQGLGSGILG